MISSFSLNEPLPTSVLPVMKAIHLPALLSLSLATILTAQTCREVVRDASGRIVHTIDRQKSTGGRVQATTRDTSGRIIGTATTKPKAGGSAQTTYRDASGRLTGTATTQPTAGTSSRTTYRDASGHLAGSAEQAAAQPPTPNTATPRDDSPAARPR